MAGFLDSLFIDASAPGGGYLARLLGLTPDAATRTPTLPAQPAGLLGRAANAVFGPSTMGNGDLVARAGSPLARDLNSNPNGTVQSGGITYGPQYAQAGGGSDALTPASDGYGYAAPSHGVLGGNSSLAPYDSGGILGNSPFMRSVRGGIAGMANSTGYTGLSAVGAGFTGATKYNQNRRMFDVQNQLYGQQFTKGNQDLASGNLNLAQTLFMLNAKRNRMADLSKQPRPRPLTIDDLAGNPSLANDLYGGGASADASGQPTSSGSSAPLQLSNVSPMSPPPMGATLDAQGGPLNSAAASTAAPGGLGGGGASVPRGAPSAGSGAQPWNADYQQKANDALYDTMIFGDGYGKLEHQIAENDPAFMAGKALSQQGMSQGQDGTWYNARGVVASAAEKEAALKNAGVPAQIAVEAAKGGIQIGVNRDKAFTDATYQPQDYYGTDPDTHQPVHMIGNRAMLAGGNAPASGGGMPANGGGYRPQAPGGFNLLDRSGPIWQGNSTAQAGGPVAPSAPAGGLPTGGAPAAPGVPSGGLRGEPYYSPEAKKTGELNADTFKAYTDEAAAAANGKSSIEQMRVAAQGFTPGAFANWKATGRRFLVDAFSTLGADQKTLDAIGEGPLASVQEFNKLGIGLTASVVRAMGPREAAQIFNTIRTSFPNPEMDPLAMSHMFASLQGTQDWTMARLQYAQSWKDKFGTLDGFQAAWTRAADPVSFVAGNLDPKDPTAAKFAAKIDRDTGKPLLRMNGPNDPMLKLLQSGEHFVTNDGREMMVP